VATQNITEMYGVWMQGL